jgi:predicted nucleotidyltransferase
MIKNYNKIYIYFSMEDIKDRLSEYKYNFFTNLQNYLGSELIFYGSIKRYDYFKESSDIDITVITDNIKSTLLKLQVYLKVQKGKIKKLIQKFTHQDSNIVNGYKIKYKDIENDIIFDILVYDEKYRIPVMNNINKINNLPTYMIVLMCILKYLYYTLGLLTKGMFLDIKNFIFTWYFTNKLNFDKKNYMSTIFLDE